MDRAAQWLTLVVAAWASVGCEDVDPHTKVLAENVLLDNSQSSLEATDVQGAFDEVQPRLSEIIVGTWDVVDYRDGPGDRETGVITFAEDGSVAASGSVLMFGVILGNEEFVGYTTFDESILQITKTEGAATYKVNMTFSTLSSTRLVVDNRIFSGAGYATKGSL